MLQSRVHSLTIPHYHTSGYAYTYYPKRYGFDAFSQALLEMKGGKRPDMEGLFALRIYEFIVQNNLSLSGIIRVLGSKEMVDTHNHPLHRIATEVSQNLDIAYHDDWLSKKPTQKTASLGSKNNRQRHLHKSYTATELANTGERHSVLVIDDIITTKTTALEIQRALIDGNPALDLHFFAFANTYYQHAYRQPLLQKARAAA